MRRHRIIRTNKQRIAWTNTSPISDDEVVAAIKFVAEEVDLDGVVIHVKKAGPRRGTYGLAYGVIPRIANLDGLQRSEWRYLITVTDGRGENWIRTLAHEAKHVEQYRRGTIRHEKKNRNCEAQAHAFGAWAAERWKARG